MRRVVITGLGAVSPLGSTVEKMWNGMTEGRCAIDKVTRFDTSALKVHLAAEVRDFDPLTCMEKADIRKTDLYVQYAMGAATQAMAQSGLEGKIAPERLGVYIGSGIGGILTFVAECDKVHEKGVGRVSPFFIPMIISNMAAGKVAMRFQAMGPTLPVVTACATSSHTIGEAFRAIAHGYADAIIAGGSEASLAPMAMSGFANMQALTTAEDPTQASIPFDARRSGFVMGEGAGVLVLEEYEHAKARGAEILGEICGYGNTCDAYHITSPRPDALRAANAIRQAVAEAGFDGSEELYINAHGTSTPPNDRTETLAIKSALGEDWAYKASVSSTKSMTGHMLGAAGAIEAIACVLALREGIIPPTIGYREKDPECDLDITPNEAVRRPVTAALSTSLGFGGHNACLALRKFEE